MSKKMYEEENIRSVAEKIRDLTGTDTEYYVSEMADGVEEVAVVSYLAGQLEIDEVKEVNAVQSVAIGENAAAIQSLKESKGAANGIATLDENGHVLSTQLPAYVDSVAEGYITEDRTKFYEDEEKTIEITPEPNKIYIDLDGLCSYRWSGTLFSQISESLALGETANTAYYGDKGKVAYDHSLKTSGNPHGVTAEQIGALPLTGGTMRGDINFGTSFGVEGTTASGIFFDIIRLINSTRFRVGGTYPALEFVGKNERPTYNGIDVALYSDVGSEIVAATSTDGIAYNVTAPSITATDISELVGKSLIIIPDMTSTSNTATLNVNGLGARGIKRWDNLYTHEYWSFSNAGWCRAGYPFRVMFNGDYWMVEGMNRPYASDLKGIIPIANGGTGGTDVATARANLGLKTKTLKFTFEDGTTTELEVYAK